MPIWILDKAKPDMPDESVTFVTLMARNSADKLDE
jgi:hypothetical protein